MLLRQIHAYIGALIAPSVLFFALTGALQLFSLHEAHGDYQPPQLIERLAQVHKNQVLSLGKHHHAPPAAASPAAPAAGSAPDEDRADADHDHDHDHDRADRRAAAQDAAAPPPAGAAPAKGGGDRQPALKTYLLKWFFLVVALGLAASTVTGAWIGLTRRRGRAVTAILLAIGVVLPVLLLIV